MKVTFLPSGKIDKRLLVAIFALTVVLVDGAGRLWWPPAATRRHDHGRERDHDHAERDVDY